MVSLLVITIHTIPYHTIPYHTIPYHTIPYHTIPYHTIPYHTIPYHAMPCHAMPCHAMPCHAMPCHAMPCHAMPCHAMPCHAMPCHTIPYHTIPYHTTAHQTTTNVNQSHFVCISLAFKGKLLSIDERDQWLRLTFDVVEVYKESITGKLTKKTTQIEYTKKTTCKCPEFAGKIDHHFLIMGKNLGLEGSNKVVLGSDVFVKEWPKDDPGKFFKRFTGLLGRDGC